MAEYPDAIFEPRTKDNYSLDPYDPDDPVTILAEDAQDLDNEVVAIETELGLNPKGSHASVKDRLDDVDTSKEDIFEGTYYLANFIDPGDFFASDPMPGALGVFIFGYISLPANVTSALSQGFQVETAIGSGVYTTVQLPAMASNVANPSYPYHFPFSFFVPAGRRWKHIPSGKPIVSSLSGIVL